MRRPRVQVTIIVGCVLGSLLALAAAVAGLALLRWTRKRRREGAAAQAQAAAAAAAQPPPDKRSKCAAPPCPCRPLLPSRLRCLIHLARLPALCTAG